MPNNPEIARVLERHAALTYDEGKNVLSGAVDIGYGDRYQVEVHLSGFPNRFPRVWEVGERIPRIDDRHVNRDPDNSLCLTTSTKEQILIATKVQTLLQFFDLILVPYLQNNSYYELHGEYCEVGYSHSKPTAIFETYAELLSINDGDTVVDTVRLLIDGYKLEPNASCFCGSGNKTKKCGPHLEAFRTLKLLPKGKLKEDLAMIEEHLRTVGAKSMEAGA